MPELSDPLNYHHLKYFWLVAREGGVGRAARVLRLSHTTVSAQVHALEELLGEPLLEKQGRGLVLTEMGRVVYAYAEQIFALGRELVDTVQGRPTRGPLRLSVGVADVVPKLVVKTLLEPALHLGTPVRLECREDRPDALLKRLADHQLDVVLSDAPLAGEGRVRAFSHLLGESTVGAFAAPALAARLRRNFPRSLDEAPLLMPSEHTALRRALDAWFVGHDLRAHVVGEFDDTELIKTFAVDGLGVFFAPLLSEKALRAQQGARRVGALEGVAERYFAVTIERRVKHPAVAAILEVARARLFSV
jgi:LysR family transcriptional regulator, transcriptional activator of nhaA